MTRHKQVVTGGVDTHKDLHVAAVVDGRGMLLGSEQFATTPQGYRSLLTWFRTFGEVDKVGVEGTGAYGAGLARFLGETGVEVVEVNRTNRQMRRSRGKSDIVDAEAAARAALNGEATVAPKAHDGIVESIRALRMAFTSARNSRSRVSNQIRDLVLTAPDLLREVLGPLSCPERVERCARFRIVGDLAEPTEGTRMALRMLARRYQTLTTEMVELESQLDALTARANPALRGARGVGSDVASILLVAVGDNPERMTNEAAFAALCGAAPVDASSGKVVRHRLNRAGNRQANHALWRIVMVRLTCDPATQHYMERRTTEGKTQREIVRCLKRHVAREVFRLLVEPAAVPAGFDLRTKRETAGATLSTVAEALLTSITTISRLERAKTFDTELALRYEAWLHIRLVA